MIVLLPRFKPGWVAPGTYQEELPKRTEELGAPKAALPVIMPNGKPICSATIRAGPGYLEVPFFATQETRRRKGYGRGLLQVRFPDSHIPLAEHLKPDLCCFLAALCAMP